MLAPTIVYDLDGTLADTAEDLVATLNWLLGREGLAPLKVESAGSLVGAGARALIKRGFAASGKTLDPQELEALFADYLGYYKLHIADRTRLYPGVDKALTSFARAGWRQAVCTNKIESLAKLLIAKLGIADRFAFICGQDTFGVGKPDAKPLLETIAASGGAKERAIMVGDSGTDIKTARAAGVPVIAVDFGYSRCPGQGTRTGPGDLAFRSADGSLRRAVGIGPGERRPTNLGVSAIARKLEPSLRCIRTWLFWLGFQASRYTRGANWKRLPGAAMPVITLTTTEVGAPNPQRLSSQAVSGRLNYENNLSVGRRISLSRQADHNKSDTEAGCETCNSLFS